MCSQVCTAHMGTRRTLVTLLHPSPHYSYDTGSFAEPRARLVAASPGDPPVSVLPSQALAHGSQASSVTPALSLGAGIWIHFLVLAQPPTEPTPQQDVEKLVVYVHTAVSRVHKHGVFSTGWRCVGIVYGCLTPLALSLHSDTFPRPGRGTESCS